MNEKKPFLFVKTLSGIIIIMKARVCKYWTRVSLVMIYLRHGGLLARLFHLCSVFISLYGIRYDESYVCTALVWSRDFKNDVCYVQRTYLASRLEERRLLMRMTLRTTYVSCVAHLFGLAALKERRMLHAYGFKNDEYYMRMALRTTYNSSVARLFGLMAERYFLCLSPTDFR